MADNVYRLAYANKDDFVRQVKPQTLKVGDRVSVKLSDKTDYVFSYMGAFGDQLNGLSALNGRQVIVDPDTMTLAEHQS